MKKRAQIKSKRPIALLSVLLLVGVAAGVYLFNASHSEAPPRKKPPESQVSLPAPVPSALTPSPVRGAPAAPVTIEEFSDFQCPFCARSVATVKQILDAYPGRVRWVFRHFPVFESHPDAPALHLVAIAAGEQGRFWEMHDFLFENRDHITRDEILSYARRLNLDMKRFEASLGDRSLIARMETDYNEGVARGVQATPTFFINGRKVEGALPYPRFKQEVERALAAAK